MLGVLVALAAWGPACAIERANYVLRGTPQITAHFEQAPSNSDWPSGLVLAVHGANTDQTTWRLLWSGGTDDGRHVRRTKLHEDGADLEIERRSDLGDLDFYTTDLSYGFLPTPKGGDAAPAHLLVPMLGDVLWHRTVHHKHPDSAPRAFFDRVDCRRSTTADQGKKIVLPLVP